MLFFVWPTMILPSALTPVALWVKSAATVTPLLRSQSSTETMPVVSVQRKPRCLLPACEAPTITEPSAFMAYGLDPPLPPIEPSGCITPVVAFQRKPCHSSTANIASPPNEISSMKDGKDDEVSPSPILSSSSSKGIKTRNLDSAATMEPSALTATARASDEPGSVPMFCVAPVVAVQRKALILVVV
ncbi:MULTISPECIES: hypothetical protein [Agrobacterium]|uniref:hypothetical protein n=1 Tax=Agrobacterium TaxID=357 RepID=UPI001E510AF8|nr:MULTISPECIES: hypothetical protein [Agrobacterium]